MDSERYTCSPDQAADYLPTSSSAINQSAPSRSTPTAAPSCESEPPMDGGPVCACMSKISDCSIHPSTPDEWIASQAASLARILARLEEARVLPGSDQDSGASSPASFAWYDPDTHSLKTAQCSLLADSMSSSVTLPRWGLMRNGRLYQRPIPVLRIGESASGYWPTPKVSAGDYSYQPGTKKKVMNLSGAIKLWPTPDASAMNVGADPQKHMKRIAKLKEKGINGNGAGLTLGIACQMRPTPRANESTESAETLMQRGEKQYGRANRNGMNLTAAVKLYPTPTASMQDTNTMDHQRLSGQQRAAMKAAGEPNKPQAGGSLNPTWVEWLMGWPIEFTASKHWATAKSRSKPRSRGES